MVESSRCYPEPDAPAASIVCTLSAKKPGQGRACPGLYFKKRIKHIHFKNYATFPKLIIVYIMQNFNNIFHRFSFSTFSTILWPFPLAVCAESLFPQIAFDFFHQKEYNKRKLISFCNFTEHLQKKVVPLCLLPSKMLQSW